MAQRTFRFSDRDLSTANQSSVEMLVAKNPSDMSSDFEDEVYVVTIETNNTALFEHFQKITGVE